MALGTGPKFGPKLDLEKSLYIPSPVTNKFFLNQWITQAEQL